MQQSLDKQYEKEESNLISSVAEVFSGEEGLTDDVLQDFVDLKYRLVGDNFVPKSPFDFTEFPKDLIDKLPEDLKRKVIEAQLHEVALKSSVSLMPNVVSYAILNQGPQEKLPTLEDLRGGVTFSLRYPLESLANSKEVASEIRIKFEEFVLLQGGFSVDADEGLINGVLFSDPHKIVEEFSEFYESIVGEYNIDRNSFKDLVFGLGVFDEQQIRLEELGERKGIKYLGISLSGLGPVSPVNNATKHIPNHCKNPPFLFVSLENRDETQHWVRDEKKETTFYVADTSSLKKGIEEKFIKKNAITGTPLTSVPANVSISSLRNLQRFSLGSFVPPKYFEKWFIHANSNKTEPFDVIASRIELPIQQILPDITGLSSLSELFRSANEDVLLTALLPLMKEVIQHVLDITPLVSNFAGDSVVAWFPTKEIKNMGIAAVTTKQIEEIEEYVSNFAKHHLNELKIAITGSTLTGNFEGSNFLQIVDSATKKDPKISLEIMEKCSKAIKTTMEQLKNKSERDIAIKKLLYIAIKTIRDKEFGIRLDKSEESKTLLYKRLGDNSIIEVVK